jgi:hypothetical protein
MTTIDNEAPIGTRLKPLLVIIENAIWDEECSSPLQPHFDDDAFRACIKIFACAFIERVWNLQEKENLSDDDRVNMASAAAADLRNLIKVYTDIDTKLLYENIMD